MLDERLRSLLEAPAPAVLTTYRRDGSAATSPVWFRYDDDAVEVVVAQGDIKLKHLARRPGCVLVVFEAVPRSAVFASRPSQSWSQETSRRFVWRSRAATSVMSADDDSPTSGNPRGTVLRFPVAAASSWDLSAILPD